MTLHRAGQVLASHPARISGRAGTVELPAPEGPLVVRASAYNALRQRSEPLETLVEGADRAG